MISKIAPSVVSSLGLLLGFTSFSADLPKDIEVSRIPAAADCGAEVRLDAPGGSMEHVKVRNQRSIGSCYAHAAAQIYDAWRFRHGDTEFDHSSAGFEISQRFKWDREETSVDGGHVRKIMPKLLEEGTCSQEELDSLFRGISLDEYASNVMGIFNRYRTFYYEKLKESFPETYRSPQDNLRLQQSGEIRNFARQDDLRVVGPRLEFEMRKIIAHQVLDAGIAELKGYNRQVCVMANPHIPYGRLRPDSNTVHMFEMISLAECPTQRRLYTADRNETFSIKEQLSYSNGKGLIPGFLDQKESFYPEVSLGTIRRELDKGIRGAYPIGISYCSKILGNGMGFQALEPSTNECGRHASLVTGRRKNPKNGRCELLIRNTWGGGCGYHSDWTCDSAQGSIWVDQEKLGQSIFSVQTVVPTRRN